MDLTMIDKNLTFEEYVSIDDNLVVTGPLTDDEIISNVLGNEDEEEEEEEEERNTTPVINAKCGLKYISAIRRFFEQNVVPDEVFNAIHMIESNLENCVN